MHNYLYPQENYKPAIGDAVEWFSNPGSALLIYKIVGKCVRANLGKIKRSSGMFSAGGGADNYRPYYTSLMEDLYA